MEESKKNEAFKNQDQQDFPRDADKDKTNQDFTGYPHYPANEEMLKNEDEANASDDDKSFNAPDSGKNAPTYPKKEELRGEMDTDSNDLPGKKDDENREA